LGVIRVASDFIAALIAGPTAIGGHSHKRGNQIQTYSSGGAAEQNAPQPALAELPGAHIDYPLAQGGRLKRRWFSKIETREDQGGGKRREDMDRP
jgi:hypothetical protein